MKGALLALLALAACGPPALASDASGNPLAKVMAMITDLQRKVLKEGEAGQKAYKEFADWCEDRARDLTHEIKAGKSEVESLQAAIDDEAAVISSLTAKVEQLASDIASYQADLKAAAEVRARDHSDFATEEKELMQTTDTITRAIAVLEKEQAKGRRSMLQVDKAAGLASALGAIVQASLIATADADRLTAFLQQQAQAKEDDEDDSDGPASAPAAGGDEGKSTGIIDTLEDLSDKAEAALAEARKKETSEAHNFEMLKMSLQDQTKMAASDMDEAKKDIAMATEKRSTAQGELQVANGELAADIQARDSLHHDCVNKADDFAVEVKSRGEEMTALTEAKNLLTQATARAGQALNQETSFVQTAMASQRFKVVRVIRELAHRYDSPALTQLSMRIAATIRISGGADGLDKVKALIRAMIAKLEKQADGDSTKQVYCNKEFKDTTAKKQEKIDAIGSLTTKIDEAAARAAKLSEEVAGLEAEMSKLTKSQGEMDRMRQTEHALYVQNKAEQEQALNGVRMALKVLNEYYAKKDTEGGSSDGSSTGIIGLLEVVESDMSKELAELHSAEEAATADYNQVKNSNAIERATKEKDITYKTKESKELGKAQAELSGDRSGEQAELDAVQEYLRKIQEECIAKPEKYEERAKRRNDVITGLKEALRVLPGAAPSLLQTGSRHHLLRGRSQGRQGILG